MLTEGAILLPVPASFKASYSLSPLMLFSLPVPPHHTLLTLYPFHHPVVPRHTKMASACRQLTLCEASP